MTTKAAILRQLLASGEMLVAPGCHDPLTARIVEELGFRAVYLGGWATGAHLVHTEPLLQMNDQVELAANVDKVVGVPVIVDADAGWGDALHTMRTVREFEHAGIAAIHIEDQVVPKRASYFREIIHIIPRDEFIQKMQFAVQARRDKDTVIIGRTDAFSAQEGSREEAIARATAMVEAGVDLVFLRGVTEPADMEYFWKALPDVPQFTTANVGDLPIDLYRDLGFKVLVYPVASVMAMYEAVRRVYTALRDTGKTTFTREHYGGAWNAIQNTLGQSQMWQVESQTVETVAERPNRHD